MCALVAHAAMLKYGNFILNMILAKLKECLCLRQNLGRVGASFEALDEIPPCVQFTPLRKICTMDLGS